ncbi:TVP38/TMEM64 family membrane protein slr0305-like [Juglans microcarpa x Juglans regia]|uniref:TVP38/TMEM64 family membrane protein slr0305-like n=1 Tax=Juglans microcarpa x Juglans regia TaxID=2249226 RepID=UPI001B7E70D5|nr:TVP38/TMEM64 family membrane protein slr0305-like [Juglans microcarpa x Juglans regia]
MGDFSISVIPTTHRRIKSKIAIIMGSKGFPYSTTCFTLPVDKILKELLLWIDQDLGPWGPVVLVVAYIPLTMLNVPASVLTLGGHGYVFGLLVGFVAHSIGAIIGVWVAFLLGEMVKKSVVVSKLKDYPQFQSVAIVIHK